MATPDLYDGFHRRGCTFCGIGLEFFDYRNRYHAQRSCPVLPFKRRRYASTPSLLAFFVHTVPTTQPKISYTSSTTISQRLSISLLATLTPSLTTLSGILKPPSLSKSRIG